MSHGHNGRGIVAQTSDGTPSEPRQSNYSSLYMAPTPRQEYINGVYVKNHGEKNGKSDESWVELFIDLVYVSLLLKLGSLGVSCYNKEFIIGRVFVLFANLILTRYAIDEYANRFFSHDLVHKLLYFLYIIGVFVQVLNINTSYDKDKKCKYVPAMSVGIMSGIMMTKICIIAMHMMVIYHNHAAKLQFRWDIVRWLISLGVMSINLILHFNGYEYSEWLDFLMILILITQEFIIWIVSRTLYRKYYTYPIDLESYQTRWGMWIMIVIGESVIQLLIAELKEEYILKSYLYSIISLTILFSLGMQYYDSCTREWYDHAMTKSAWAGITWIWLQPLLSFFLFGVGAAFKMSSSYYEYGVIYNSNRLLSICIGLSTLSFSAIRFAHEGFVFQNESYFWLFFIRVILSAAQITVFIWPMNHGSRLYCAVCQLIINTIGFNFVDIYFEVHYAHVDKQEHHKKKASRAWNTMGMDSKNKEDAIIILLIYKIFPCLRQKNNNAGPLVRPISVLVADSVHQAAAEEGEMEDGSDVEAAGSENNTDEDATADPKTKKKKSHRKKTATSEPLSGAVEHRPVTFGNSKEVV